MSQYSAVKAIVNAYIRQNGRQEITGDILNSVLNATIDSLGKYFQFAGGASPTDDPGDPDQNLCYLASGPGVYTHFGNIVVDDEEVALLLYDGQWVKQSVLIGIKEVTASVDDGVGTPSVDVSYDEGTLVLTFHNLKGVQGVQGVPAGFGTVEALIGEGPYPGPRVFVTTSGPDTAKNIEFDFVNLKGDPGDPAGFGTISATVGDDTGIPSVTVVTSGPDTAKNIAFAFDGLKGLKGDTGVSADYPITIYNGLDSDATDQALAAAQGKVLQGEIDQLGHEVHNMSNKFYGVFLSAADLPNDVTEPGYAYVGSSSPFAIYNFDGNTWTDSETTMDSMYGPSVNPFKGFFISAVALNSAYPGPQTGQYAYVNQGGTPAVAHIYFSDNGVWTDSGVEVAGDQESGFTTYAKSLLIFVLSKVAWTDSNAQSYLSSLEDALVNDINIDHLTAVFAPGSEIITDNNTLDDLRQYLTVTAFYNNGTSEIVTTYTLAGTMSAGTQTITVDYLGTTDTFTVNVIGNYAEEIDNWMYHPGNSVAQYDSRGYIALKCSNATELNNYNCYVADVKKTLWSTVNGKTVKIRINTNSTTDGLFGIGIYSGSSITAVNDSTARRAGLPDFVLADDGYYEQTFVCDIANFTIGSLTPGVASTFGIWCYSRSTSVWTQIFDVQIIDVTP